MCGTTEVRGVATTPEADHRLVDVLLLTQVLQGIFTFVENHPWDDLAMKIEHIVEDEVSAYFGDRP